MLKTIFKERKLVLFFQKPRNCCVDFDQILASSLNRRMVFRLISHRKCCFMFLYIVLFILHTILILNILLVEPFFSGSHQSWAKSYQHSSQHHVDIISLPGRHWKWRMYGGAVSLARKYMEIKFSADLILATDMLDFGNFLSLTRQKSAKLPTAIYFHENQISYPWSPQDKDPRLDRNNQYGFINYTSALNADAVFFNSAYHKQSFLEHLSPFLKQFPDRKELQNIALIEAKSKVLSLGLNLKKFDRFQTNPSEGKARILWNHRWEYDKNPSDFFELLFQLKEEGFPFQVIVLGEAYQKQPPIFAEAKERLADCIIHIGFTESFEDYANYLWQADILPVTGNQDFFGASVVEAMYCNCFPILPNRLAYPEHIPRAFHKNYLYETKTALYQRLKFAIINIDKIRASNLVQNFVAQYDWSKLASGYDRALQEIRTSN